MRADNFFLLAAVKIFYASELTHVASAKSEARGVSSTHARTKLTRGDGGSEV